MTKFNDNLTILHISDLHFGESFDFYNEEGEYKECCKEINEKIIKVLEDLGKKQADLLLITGDIGSTGIDNDFTDAKLYLNTYFSDYLPHKILIVPGNHDLEWSKEQKKVANPRRFNAFYNFLHDLGLIKNDHNYYEMPHLHQEFKDLLTLIYGINSCMYTSYETDSPKANFNKDHENRAQINDNKFLLKLQEIDKIIPFNEQNRHQFRIVLMHHNLLPYNVSVKELIKPGISLRRDREKVKNKGKKTTLKDVDAFIRKLKDYGFNIFLHGHRHIYKIFTHEGAIIIGTGSIYVNPDHREKNCFNIINIEKHYEDIGNSNFRRLVTNACVKKIIIDFDNNYDVDASSDIDCREISQREIIYDKETKKVIDFEKLIKKQPIEAPTTLAIIIEAIKKSKLNGKEDFSNDIKDYCRENYNKIKKIQPVVERIITDYETEVAEYGEKKANYYLLNKFQLLPNNRLIEIKSIENDYFFHSIPKLIEEDDMIEGVLKLEIIQSKIHCIDKTKIEKAPKYGTPTKILKIDNVLKEIDSKKFVKKRRAKISPTEEPKILIKKRTPISRVSTSKVSVGKAPAGKVAIWRPAAKKGEGYIAKAPIRRLMKKEGADLVAAEALDKLIDYLESAAANTTKKAIKVCKADKRKRVTAADIRNATR